MYTQKVAFPVILNDIVLENDIQSLLQNKIYISGHALLSHLLRNIPDLKADIL